MSTFQSQSKRYLIQHRHWSLDKRFTITDGSGTLHYKGNSIFFAVGDKLSLSDKHGNELIRIRQENLRIHLTYKVFSVCSDSTESQLALIKRTGPFWQRKLEINSVNGDYKLRKTGGLSSNKFSLTKGDNVVAIANKDASPTKSFYWIDIADEEENHAFLLTIMMVLACAQHLPGNLIAICHTSGSKV